LSAPLLVVMPARNEAANLLAVVTELRSVWAEAEVVVVDDASDDGTADVARRIGCRTLVLPFRLGYGGALQAGVKFALRRRADVVVTFDADGQHDPRDIAVLLAAVESGADLALGSRFLAEGSYRGGAFRQFGRRLFAALARSLTGFALTDPTSGLKALGPRAQRLFALARFPDRFPDADALVLARRARLSVTERPARMRASRNRHSMHDGPRALAYTFNMAFSLLAAALGREADLEE